MMTLDSQCTFEAYVLESKQSLAWNCICGYRVIHSILCNALSPWLRHFAEYHSGKLQPRVQAQCQMYQHLL